MKFDNIREYAKKMHENAGNLYDGKNYIYHLDMVVETLDEHLNIFKHPEDKEATIKAAFCHDILEDTNESIENLIMVIGKDSTNIVICVTDVFADTRTIKHEITMEKTVKDYRAIILKLCDIYANTLYSKINNISMFNRYKTEYEQYRERVFFNALINFGEHINQKELKVLQLKLHNINIL